MIGLGWLAYVRADYRDSANNESHDLVSWDDFLHAEAQRRRD